jgi:hypothetical protein
MKDTYIFIKRHLRLNQRTSILFTPYKSIKYQVAGIIGATSGAFKGSRVYGGIVHRTACADPTPDSVISFLQAYGNYSYVSAHPYRGLFNLIPAACINNSEFDSLYRSSMLPVDVLSNYQGKGVISKILHNLFKKITLISVIIIMALQIVMKGTPVASTSGLSLLTI